MIIKEKIIVCIPTYDRSKIIDCFLQKYVSAYFQADCDIAIFDSSDNFETENIVSEFNSKSLNTVYYFKVDSSVHSNDKVYNIFQDKLALQYRYLWVHGDGIWFSRDALVLINDAKKQLYDVIIPNGMNHGAENLPSQVYSNADDLLRDCGWFLTLYGGSLLRTDTFLNGIDWSYYSDKYLTEKTINYSHVCFIIERFGKSDNYKAFHLSLQPEMLGTSPLKKQTGWYTESFSIICETAYNSFLLMPGSLSCKYSAIKKLGIYSTFNRIESFYKFRRDKVYNTFVFLKYFQRWPLVCNYSRWRLFCIAIRPLMFDKLKKWIIGQRVLSFCKRNYNRRLYIYGAGQVGMMYHKYLTDHSIKIESFIVSSKDNNPVEIMGEKVLSLDMIKNDIENSAIIVGVGRKLSYQVLSLLHDMKMNLIFYSENFYDYYK